ncbi:MAG: hypothetical protein IJA26_04895 [Clostridia bacterium]|nr:hypothetical protein [Clostridia bacterium]
MKKCCICGRDILSSDPFVLFESSSGRDMYSCDACEKQMNTLMEGENPAEVKKAVNYFYTYAKEAEDDEVKGFLEDIVESNAAAVDELSAAAEKKKPIEHRQMDYFADRDAAAKTTSGWIVILNIFAVIYFVGMIVFGIFTGAMMISHGDFGGLGIILALSAMGLMLFSFYMVIIHMAKDIKIIRAKLEEKK